MEVRFGSLDALVTERFADELQIRSLLKRMRGVRVAEPVGRNL